MSGWILIVDDGGNCSKVKGSILPGFHGMTNTCIKSLQCSKLDLVVQGASCGLVSVGELCSAS